MGESEIVAVTVTLTREDYAAALRVLNEPSSWPKQMLFWLSVVILGYFCYKWLRLPDHSPLVGILGLVGLAIFLSARTSVKKNPDKLGPAKHSVGPDGTCSDIRHGLTADVPD